MKYIMVKDCLRELHFPRIISETVVNRYGYINYFQLR